MFQVQSQPKSANIPRTIRFSETLFSDLQQVAQEKDVSFNSLVLQCCQYALDHLNENEDEMP